MSTRTNILSRVQSYLAGVTGVKFVEIGLPNGPIPFTSCPFIYLTTTDNGGEDYTFGGAGRSQDVQWYVNINMVFGPADYELSRVVADAQPMPSRVRAQLTADFTQGGVIDDSDLMEAIDNFDTYRETGVVPMMRWRLLIHQYLTPGTPPDNS